jgi:nitric oxide synthase oxygenase domain/subunit
MVVKGQIDAGNEWQVGRDIALGDLDFAILHILGMNELDVIDHVQFIEQNGADQTIEVAAGDQAVFLGSHMKFSGLKRQTKKYFQTRYSNTIKRP